MSVSANDLGISRDFTVFLLIIMYSYMPVRGWSVTSLL